MDDFCPVCNKKMSLMTRVVIQEGITIHHNCIQVFEKEPEKYGGTAIKKTETQFKSEKERKEHQQKEKEEFDKLQKEIKEKSVYIKGGVNVKSFDMPFGDMVGFIFKWVMASIPTAIFLAILLAIFTAIFA